MNQRTAVHATRRALPATIGRMILMVEALENRLPPAGHSLASAGTPALGPLDMATVGGYLASPAQVDLYRVQLGAGDRLTTSIVAQTAGSGLDPIVRVFAADGQQVAADDQQGGNPGLTFQAAARGDYFVGVSSAGDAGYDPVPATGYTGGTTTGTYSLNLAVRAGLPLASDLAGGSFRLAEATAEWGQVVYSTFTIDNRGGAEAGPFTVQLYVSPNGLINPQTSIPLLTTPLTVDGLAAGGEWSSTELALTLPSLAAAKAAGLSVSGPVAIGLRITPADPTKDSGTTDKGGVHRGEDWESLTVLTPVVGSVADLAVVDPALNTQVSGIVVPGTSERQPFTVSAAGEFTVRATPGSPDVHLTVSLYGGANGQAFIIQSETSAGQPVATLTQYITPGTYVVVVTADQATGYQLTTTLTAASDPSQPIQAGAGPNSLAVGDFDGSGRLDLAVADVSGTTVSILLGNGDGSFQAGPSLSVGGSPSAVVAADLTGNGKTDLVVTNFSGSVDVFMGNGDGSFQPMVSYSVGVGPVGVAVADVNGDGIPDIVVANSNASVAGTFGTVGVLLGNGDGTFQKMQTITVGANTVGVAVADLNGDGIPDIVVTDNGTATTASNVEVLLGKGNGTFRPGPVLTDPLGPRTVVVADLNGDGIPDIVVGNAGPANAATSLGTTVGAFLGEGNGAFQPMTTVTVGNQPFSLTVADLNNDGKLDIVAANYTDNTASILLGNGDGTFEAQSPINVPSKPGALAVADMNGDGVPDLIVAEYGTVDNPGSGVSVLLGNGNGSFQGPPVLPSGSGPVALATADFNNDGKPDVVIADANSNQLTVDLGNGDGTFTSQPPVTVGDDPQAVVATDLINDGKSDLVVANYSSNTVGVLLGNGDGTFQPMHSYPVGAGPAAVAVADLSGNKIMDIVVVNDGDSDIGVLLGNGNGTFQPMQTYHVPRLLVGPLPASQGYPSLGLTSVQIADVNGDGIPDIIVADSLDDMVDVLLGNGNGTFRLSPPIPVPQSPTDLQVADVNGDRIPDIVVLNQNSNTVGVLLGNGDGTFKPERTYPAGNDPQGMTVATVTHNGLSDLLVTNANENTVSVLLNEGGGNFELPRPFATGQGPGPVVVADLNGDGNMDIITGNDDDDTITSLLGNGEGTFTAATQATGVAPTSTPELVPLDGTAAPLDSVTLDGAGALLYRKGLPGVANEFNPPVTLNPGDPARAFTSIKTPTGWAIAAADTNPTRSSTGQFDYTVSLYTVKNGVPVLPPTIAFSTPFVPTRIVDGLLSNGLDDIVVADSLNDTIQIAYQMANGAFQTPLTTLTTAQAPSAIAIADVNGDGLNDIVVTNQASGEVNVFLNDRSHPFASEESLRAGITSPNVVTSSTITTVAGDNFLPYVGDGGPATAAILNYPGGVAVDATTGNLFIADTFDNSVREVSAKTGIITTIAGTGVSGYSGDDGPANVAELDSPEGLVVDAAGDLFIADTDNNVIREVNTKTGIITTVAGNGTNGYMGDNGLATDAELCGPYGVAIDPTTGGLVIADTGNNVIREVASGIITTIAGGGTMGYQDGQATATELSRPAGVAVDAAGDVYIADTGNNAVREVTSGMISTVAGNGTSGYMGDNGLATAAELSSPERIAVDPTTGNLFIADEDNNVIREVTPDGTIRTCAGTGMPGFSGDQGAATDASLYLPQAVAVDAAGDLFIADTINNVVREVTPNGTITTYAGNPQTGYYGNGGPATGALLDEPSSVAVDPTTGNLFIADEFDNVVREVSANTGVITTVAGTGVSGYSGDGGPATAAELNSPSAVAVDSHRDLFIADSINGVIREVAAGTGTISTFADNREIDPEGLAVDAAGDLFVADESNNEVDEVVAGTNILTVIAGNGTSGYMGDYGPAVDAELSAPIGLAVDVAGDLFIADSGNNVIRKLVLKTGIITTVAGNNALGPGYAGDGTQATAAALNTPSGVAVDGAGDLFIADTNNNVIREVNANTGVITTVAGDSQIGLDDSGDGGPATAATLDSPEGLALDAAGNLFIADSLNNVIRKVAVPQTVITSSAQTVALAVGNFTGDGGNDLLTVNRGTQSVTVLPNDGAGGFGNPQAPLTTLLDNGLNASAVPGPIVAGDFNTADGLDSHRAGRDDFAILMETLDQVWVYTNNGNGTFQQTSTIELGGTATTGLSLTPGTVATGLSLVPGSGPGLFNLLVGDQVGDVLVLIGNGKGGFQRLNLTGTSAPIAVQSVSNSHTPEAIVADQKTNTVTVQVPKRNPAQFAPITSLAPADPTTQLAPGAVLWSPLDKDTALADAIVMASGSNSMVIYSVMSVNAAGEPTFATPVRYPVGTDPVSVTVADVNGDGIPDLLVANKGSDDVSVLFGSYASDGTWVGTLGPRLKSAGAGPMSVSLVADPASPGGHDLAITNEDGTVDILPGRGQGFFDDRTPLVQRLGAPVAQPPTFASGSEVGYAVTTKGSLLQFDLADPTQSPTEVAISGTVMAADALSDGRLVAVLSSGEVDVVTPDGGETELAALGGLPSAPSALAVLVTSTEVEALVTSEGSDAIFAFTAPLSLLPVEVLPFETHSDLTADGSLALVSTLVTSLPFGPAGGTTSSGPTLFNPLLSGAATDLGPGALAQSVGLRDSDLVRGLGEGFATAVQLSPVGKEETGLATPGVPAGLQGLITGTAEGLQRLIESARSGEPGVTSPQGVAQGVDTLLEQLLRSLREQPPENPPQPAVPRGASEEGDQNDSEPGSVDIPLTQATEDGGAQDIRSEAAADDIALTDGRADECAEFVQAGGWFESVAEGIPVPVAWDDSQEAAATGRELAANTSLATGPEGASPLWLLTVLPGLLSWNGEWPTPSLASLTSDRYRQRRECVY